MDYLGTLPTTTNRIAKYSELGGGGGSGDVVGPASSTDNAIARFDLATGKLLQNSNVLITDQGVINLQSLTSPTAIAGSIYFDNTNQALAVKNSEADITLQVGQENWVRVFNNTGSTLNNGQVVYITGSDAGTGLPTIALARADVYTTSVAIGMVTHSIETGTVGYVTAFGSVRDLNTSAFTSGPIFLSPVTAGALTQTTPSSPNFTFRIGHVSVVNAVTGVVHVQLGASSQALEVLNPTNTAVNSTYPDNSTYYGRATVANGFPVEGLLTGLRKGNENTQRIQDVTTAQTYARAWLNGTSAWTAWSLYFDTQDFTAKGQLIAGTGNNAFAVLSAGTNGQVLSANSATATGFEFISAPPASAGGLTTQIQYNDTGAIAGNADFTWDNTNKTLSLLGTNTEIVMRGITAEPSSPAADTLLYYSKKIAGRMVPKIKGPSGIDTPMQNAFWQNNITMWNPTTATAGIWLGTAGSGAGTYTTALPTTTSIYTSMKRARWANVVTTTNQVLGQRNTEALYMRGSVAGQGGFFFYTRCGFDVWTNGGRFFAGMHTATTVISADPSALNNTVGFAVDAADNGVISFLTRGTAATKAATGFTIVSGKGYDIYIFCAPNSSEYGWRIVDINTGTEASGTATANLPTNTTLQTAGVLASNAALTPVTSIQLGLNRIYVETDY